jgi:hypothetical protein
LRLTFERFTEVCGVYAGTFDDPNWFEIEPNSAKQILIEKARPDSMLLPDIDAFGQHAILNDGTPVEPAVPAGSGPPYISPFTTRSR